MKKTIIAAIALALAGVASAASASRTVAPSAPNRAFTIDGLNVYERNLSGLRFGASFFKPAATRTFTHEFNVSLGYLTSTNTDPNGAEETMIPLTAGYFAHSALTDKMSIFAGGRLGIMKAERSNNGAGGGQDQDTTGPVAMIGTGIKFQLTEDAYVRVAYEFGKFLPSDDNKGWGESRGMRTLSVGVGIAF